MIPTSPAPGTCVRVKIHGRVAYAVVVASLDATKLLWVRIGGGEPTLIRDKDVVAIEESGPEPDPNDDPSVWETEVF